MKKLILSAILLLTMHGISAMGDAKALEPNITAEQRWQQYEDNRLLDKSQWESIKEFFYENYQDIKQLMLLDILFFKINRIETEFAQEILQKFGRSLDNVTILHKDLRSSYPRQSFTIFNTIVIDQSKIAKYTKEEQAFLLGHEISHLKNKHWIYKIILAALLTTLLGPPFGIPCYNYCSRNMDLSADKEAAYLLNSANEGISALEKMRRKVISKANFMMNPNGIQKTLLNWFSIIFGRHPTFEQRIEMLKKHNTITKKSTP
ncbi:MAG: M48 family metalloprotease [Candidatus Dependentiae bacterium]